MRRRQHEKAMAESWLQKAERDYATGRDLDPRMEVEYTDTERAAYHRGRAAGLTMAAESLTAS